MPTPTTDFSIFDGLELLTYSPASFPAVVDVPAVRRPLSRSVQRNVERYVELQATDVVFHLDATPFGATPLFSGDSISDSSTQMYVVLFVERQTLNNSIAAVCRPTA